MFNISVESIIIETIVYILISIIVKILLNDDDVKNIRRILLLGYLVFASLFVSTTVFIIVSIAIVLISIGIRKVFEY